MAGKTADGLALNLVVQLAKYQVAWMVGNLVDWMVYE